MCALLRVFLYFAAGAPTGTLCGEPSAPLRRCQQPLLFPKNPQPELTTIHNSGAAMIWNQRQEVPLIKADGRCFQNKSLLVPSRRCAGVHSAQINSTSKQSRRKFILQFEPGPRCGVIDADVGNPFIWGKVLDFCLKSKCIG